MKKYTLLLITFLICQFSYGQDLPGSKIINANLNINLTTLNSDYINNYNQVQASILYGKVKENNKYLAFGGTFNYLNQSNGQYEIGPAVQFGKFLPIIEKLYLAPYIGGSVLVQAGNVSGLSVQASASPLRFMYHLKTHFLLTASFGSANMNFQTNDLYTAFNLNAALSNNAAFGVFYTFK
ncbi:hypothetical protein LAG90_14670 [Marinilongibacter aquaticus]|uniref:hypothetical protein n=1 Tax=Marinilongibacter aquaticus TaxID=2975157 RepID=UPI0021BD999A|nr:hypothetical protein [Marinilongibacter aquaticus]UBM58048.1 hypothetical protein LAG90_14670 [Marinilongibacter aquaticus]